MVIEQLDQPQDLQQENEDLQKREGNFPSSVAYRLSFFTKRISNEAALAAADDKDFIGYAVVKTDRGPTFGLVQRVYESVIRPGRHDNNFVRGEQSWLCSIGGNSFHVSGYLYAQQNGLTNVCAHVALRTVAARYHKGGDMSYRDMNNLLAIDHIKVKTGGDEGLTTQQMVQVLEAAGARCFQADYSKPRPDPPPFQKYLYGSIESGFPAIVIFGTTDSSGSLHAVPVFGHTFNQDIWVPNADSTYFRIGKGTKYIPSESWLSMFIVHDDNWGSNYCIPRHYLRIQHHTPAGQPKPKPEETVSECVAHVISTLPKEIKINPIQAEAVGADYLFTILNQLPTNNSPWAKRLLFCAKRQLLVLRPYLLTSDAYIRHLEKVRDWQRRAIRPNLIAALRTTLPKQHLWMIELSMPELFPANLRKVAEVLIRAEVQPTAQRDMQSFLLARLPSYFALYEKGTAANPQYQFIPSGAGGHVELFGCEDSRA